MVFKMPKEKLEQKTEKEVQPIKSKRRFLQYRLSTLMTFSYLTLLTFAANEVIKPRLYDSDLRLDLKVNLITLSLSAGVVGVGYGISLGIKYGLEKLTGRRW